MLITFNFQQEGVGWSLDTDNLSFLFQELFGEIGEIGMTLWQISYHIISDSKGPKKKSGHWYVTWYYEQQHK